MFTDINLIVCTATATKATKSKIFEVLDLKTEDTFSIEKSPERPNIAYFTQYVENDMKLSDVFHDIILDVKDKKDTEMLGRLLRPDIVHFRSACGGTEIFLRELALLNTLSSNPKSSRSVGLAFSHKLLFYFL